MQILYLIWAALIAHIILIVTGVAIALFFLWLGWRWWIARCFVLFVSFVMMASGCARAAVTPIDFTCRSYARAEMIITECADPETWRRWLAQGEI